MCGCDADVCVLTNAVRAGGTLPPISVGGTCVLPVSWAKNLGILLCSFLSHVPHPNHQQMFLTPLSACIQIQPLLCTYTVPTLVQPPSSPTWTIMGASSLVSLPHTAKGILSEPQAGQATPLAPLYTWNKTPTPQHSLATAPPRPSSPSALLWLTLLPPHWPRHCASTVHWTHSYLRAFAYAVPCRNSSCRHLRGSLPHPGLCSEVASSGGPSDYPSEIAALSYAVPSPYCYTTYFFLYYLSSPYSSVSSLKVEFFVY